MRHSLSAEKSVRVGGASLPALMAPGGGAAADEPSSSSIFRKGARCAASSGPSNRVPYLRERGAGGSIASQSARTLFWVMHARAAGVGSLTKQACLTSSADHVDRATTRGRVLSEKGAKKVWVGDRARVRIQTS